MDDHGLVRRTRGVKDSVQAHAPAAVSAARPSRRKLYRATKGRMLGGVAQGLAAHLGIDVWIVRVAFVILAIPGGAGVAAYAAFWVLVPLEPDPGPHPDTAGAAATRSGAPLSTNAVDPAEDSAGRLGSLVGLGAIALGVAILFARGRTGTVGRLAVPAVLAGVGVALLWRVADDTQRTRWRRTASATAFARHAWIRILLGGVLVAAGAAAVLATRGGFDAAVNGLAGGLIVVVGAALVVGPWVIRSTRELGEERRERIRSQERAELAAHVHDSVVQTLTLIQRNADDPRTVTRLARAEERSLRQWLYQRSPDTRMFRTAFDDAAAEVEQVHGGALDVVVVGDALLDERLTALLLAAREAMVNAAKYASDSGPVSVYAEVEPSKASVYVRDHGPGFDPATVPADRLGLRQSIIGRMERHGGTAVVTSNPGEGAEVRLMMPLTPSANGSAGHERPGS
jgi:signal transduction histidine kinase/phage shock protein PspC (stress-responsive transcriptional regulator)